MYAELHVYIKVQKRRIKSRRDNNLYPGGLGPNRFQLYARTSYGVTMTLEQCQTVRNVWYDSFPEMAEHLRPPVDNTHFVSKPAVSPDDAGDTDETTEEEDERFYIASTITGRIRRKASFCSACNYPLAC